MLKELCEKFLLAKKSCLILEYIKVARIKTTDGMPARFILIYLFI